MEYVYKGKLDSRYTKILSEIQSKQNELFWEINQTKNSSKNRKALIVPFLSKYIKDHELVIDGYDETELVQKLYDDLEQYSVITNALNNDMVEGIDIHAWNNIRVKLHDGSYFKIDGFNSVQHGMDIVKRLLQHSNITLDYAVPMAEGSLNNNIRITALQSPLVDSNIGVAAYLRKLNKKVFATDDYIKGGFADEKEILLLETVLKRGVSILLIGKVNTGKTTFQSYLLSKLPQELKVITIEGGAREMDLVTYDENGCPENNIVHLLTKESEKEKENITQEKLVEKALRLNPDVISVAEMRNLEAAAAVEASNSGHIVISTAHAGSPQQGHKRVANLCRKKYATDFHTALEQACEAFPIVVFIHSLEDNKRRIMNVSECIVEGTNLHYQTLWEFAISENSKQNGVAVIKGNHRQISNVSKGLAEKMKMFGVSEQELNSINM